MALVYLQPGLKKFKSMRPNDFNSMDSDDNAAFLSMMFERFGGRPIISENYEARNMVNRLGEIGEYEILPALIDDKLGMSVGERIYRYMIEMKWKNNPEALARWISEYNEVYGEYEILSAEDYAIFKKACDEGYRKHASSRSADTALDFGYVIDPSKFESRISFDRAVADMADHYQHNFQESQFYKNRNNAEYVAKTYAMVKAMCENDAFTDITDIYACIVNLVEHSYGYDSTEILLADTQVVHLMAPLKDGNYDTDQDNLLDRQELSHEENVNISNLLEEYIKYNKLPEEEANKLRADPNIKMWTYKSNPALPDTDFDGRNDDYDFHRPLENRQVGKMSTLNYDSVNFDYCQDYRYFFMPSTQYYYQLSEMSMVLANMVNKKSGINRRWLKDTNYVNKIVDDGGGITINSYRERYNAYSVEDYMNYIGLEDIEVRDMSSTYEDSNVCRYAIGHRDVVYSLGRTQNVVRNVIAISIGDIESKAAELYANFDGHAGREGDYTEYHHVGFDIVANRILETVERYASRYDPRYQKVYWITGEGGGGSVANLLAQKMIKKYGNKNIYCYTFQALNTIDCNNIPAVQRISNESYGSIFNLYNDDNELIKLYSSNNSFYKYGINKHVAVSSSDEYIALWQNATGEKYNLTTKNNNAERFKEWLSESEDGVVSGFSNTNLANIFVNTIKETIIKFTAYFKSIGRSHISTSNAYENPIEQEIYDNTNKIVSASSDILYIQSGGEISGIIDAIGRKQDQKGTNVNGYNAGDNYIYDSRDGNPFGRYKDELREKDNQNLNPYNNNLEPAVKIEGFKFSNYTISSNYKDRDINYVKFWNDVSNGKLSEYRIGDYNVKTKFTCERKSEYFNNFINSFPNPTIEGSAGRIKNINGMYIIDDRILAAFPAALVGEGDYQYESFLNDMHRVSSYKRPIEWEHNKRAYTNKISQKDYGSYEGTGNGKYIGGNDIYKLVDCVFEDSGGRQFVVPFIVIDAKLLHLLPNMYDANKDQFLPDETSKMGMMSHLTDNRYGQVIEIATDSELNKYTGENDINGKTYTYYEVRDKAIIEENVGKADKDKKNAAVIISKDEYRELDTDKYQDYDVTHKIVYFDKSLEREAITLSPIEVLTDGRILADYQINEVIFGNREKHKLISMRIYKDEKNSADIIYSPDRTEYGATELIDLKSKVALQNGTPTESVWHRYKRIINEINTLEKNQRIQNEGYSSVIEYFNAGKFDKIVDY